MDNIKTPAAQANHGLTVLANRYQDVTGPPIEAETAAAPLPTSASDTLTNLYLPEELKELLEKPLTMLQLQLEATETFHKLEKKIIRHYSIRSPVGKIVLIYLQPEVVQDPSPSYWGQIFYFGTLFAAEYKSIFIFSVSENVELVYKEALKDLQEGFEKADLLLKDAIEVLQNPDIKVVVNELKDRFGLPEQTDTASVEKERTYDTVKLSELISEYFVLKELKDLCFSLQEYVEFDNLEGEGKDAKVQDLVGHAFRHGYLPQLVEYCGKVRDHVAWQEVTVEDGND